MVLIAQVILLNSPHYSGDRGTQDGLAEITIPGSVGTIGESAFAGCTGMTHVFIQDGVTDRNDHGVLADIGLDPAIHLSNRFV